MNAMTEITNIPRMSRESDERILDWVQRRASGESCHSIARRYGIGRGQVVVATTNVMKADLAASGPEAASGYWT